MRVCVWQYFKHVCGCVWVCFICMHIDAYGNTFTACFAMLWPWKSTIHQSIQPWAKSHWISADECHFHCLRDECGHVVMLYSFDPTPEDGQKENRKFLRYVIVTHAEPPQRVISALGACSRNVRSQGSARLEGRLIHLIHVRLSNLFWFPWCFSWHVLCRAHSPKYLVCRICNKIDWRQDADDGDDHDIFI